MDPEEMNGKGPSGEGGQENLEGGGGAASDSQQIDWEAKYRQMARHSREWEKKAKANEDAANELEKLKQSQMTAEQKAEQRANKLEEELKGYRLDAERRKWAKEHSEAYGVPVEVLMAMSADSEDEMKEKAESVAGFFKKQSRQIVPGDGVQPGQGEPPTNGNDWLRSTLPRMR